MSTETQEPVEMGTKPVKEHEWLQKLFGEWRVETDMMMGPDQPMAHIEGTWEEIKRHESELAGHHLRVIITAGPITTNETTESTVKQKSLRGYGMFAGLLST